jgi:hypothetical protein
MVHGQFTSEWHRYGRINVFMISTNTLHFSCLFFDPVNQQFGKL